MTQTNEKGEKNQIFPNLMAWNASSYERGRGSLKHRMPVILKVGRMAPMVKFFLMRATFVLSISLALVLGVSCRKQYSDGGAGGRTDAAGTSPIQGVLLVKQVDAWVNGDSTVTVYQYDAARLLIAEHVVGANAFDRYYFRDGIGRIVESLWVDEGDSDIRNVVYADASSGKIAYTREISGSGTSAYLDSEAYVYGENGKPGRVDIFPLPAIANAQYDSFTYDAAGNLVQFLFYEGGTPFVLNLGYDFEYDNDINPLFSYDDARLTDEWYSCSSPNNNLIQTNHYGDPPLMSSDNVVQTYTYRSDKKPATSTRGGTALSSNGATVLNTTFYYQ
jgi:hypothetical protein